MAGNSIISQPDVTINIAPAQTAVGNTAHKVLVVGQKQASGTAISGALIEQVGNDSSVWDSLFGAKSMIRNMIANFKGVNEVTRIDAIPLDDDAGGVPATGTVVFSGTATANGTIYVSVGSSNHRLSVAVTSGDTATVVGDTLVTAITADTTIPVTAANVIGTVTLTAVNDGTEGNDITLRVEESVAGITTTLTGMASGATDPSLTGLFDVVGDTRYQTVIWPNGYGLTDIKSFLDPRFNVNNAVQDGVAITTDTDTFSNLSATGNAENSESLVILGFNPISDAFFKGSSMFEQGVNISSQFAAIRSLRLTEDANISNFVITSGGPRDGFGGVPISSFPYFNTEFPNLPLIPTAKGWDSTEIESLVTAGISTIGNNSAGNATIAGEIVTTYKTDSAGNPDPSFKYLNYVDTASNAREYFFNNLKARFAQSRLTEGDLIPGRSMANEGIIRAFSLGLFNDLSGEEFVLLQAGEDARNFFNANLLITLDLENGKVTWDAKAPIVTQLRTIIGTMQVAFSVEG